MSAHLYAPFKAAAGIRAAFANSSYTASELAYILKDSGSSHVLVHGTLLPTVISALASMGISQDEAKRRVVIISPKTTVPAALSKTGWIASEDVVPGNSVLPEDFRDDQSKETVYIYYSSGKTTLIFPAFDEHRGEQAQLDSARASNFLISMLPPFWISVEQRSPFMSTAVTWSWVSYPSFTSSGVYHFFYVRTRRESQS